MPMFKNRLNMLMSNNANIRIGVAGSADSVILEIYSRDRTYLPIALPLGETRDLQILPGKYSFDFTFFSLGADATLTSTVENLSTQTTKSKEQGAAAGRRATTSIKVDI